MEEANVMGKQTSSKNMEHTYPQCNERVQDMDTRGDVSSRDIGVKLQRKKDAKASI
jgi:hypothetical protein